MPAAALAQAHGRHQDLTPQEALDLLKQGNADFVNDVPQPGADQPRAPA
jgi:hypothetical protein